MSKHSQPGNDASQPLAAPATVAVGLPAATGLRVLIAEDHDFQRRALAHLLRSLGANEVIEAGDGAEALQILESLSFDVDLILCDLDMPKMDGMEFMRHLGASDSRAAVIITSAHESNVINSVQIMTQAYGVHLLGVIEKPATRSSVSALLDKDAEGIALRRTQTFNTAASFTLDDILNGIDHGQFEPFYQPKADLATGRIIGAETLARWLHPDRGIVSPYAFIEQLEASGNLDDLTFIMLREAARACRSWNEAGLDLSVSVNLSLTSLRDTDLAEKISETVRNARLDASRVTLEITESAAMTDIAPALENLARLRLRGFGLSIDDFGTGFSSIQQLARIAFTELKIDRSFVARMTEKREARAIVEASIDMAHRLDILSVAEGIETQAEWTALKIAGCKVGQGYFISRPVDGNQFIALCKRSAR
ncbi:MAG: EAL domain-containing response regulator [Woeseia sp.]